MAMRFYDGSRSEYKNDGNIESNDQNIMNSTITNAIANQELKESTRLSTITINGSLGIPMHPVLEVEIAELTKIIENAHRYLQIAFAEDLYLYCQANGLHFSELRDSLNTKWNVNILEPREGIGGHCLPKDTKMFLNSTSTTKSSIRSKIIEAAIEVDSDFRRYRKTGRLQEIMIEENNRLGMTVPAAAEASAMV
jgi:UDP-N-acetyl-D-mannosaminuronate dehydrogenase